MPKEFETRIIDINKRKIVAKLKEIGAKKTRQRFLRRITFDFPNMRLKKTGAWIRVRDTGDGHIWMAYKCHKSSGKTGVPRCEEVEFTVGDMDQAKQFLLLVGFKQKAYQENKRTTYILGDLLFEIDEWPMLPPLIEIEGPSAKRIMEGVKMLGYSKKDTFQGHTGEVYRLHGIEWDKMKEIKF